jgi:hypothetical protein
MLKKTYVHYGGSYAGPAPYDFENFDASPTLRLERFPLIGPFIRKNPERFPSNVRYGDITKGPLVKPATASGVYCSHVLEHLSFEDCQLALRSTYAMLSPGGIFRFVFPDLRKIALDYVRGDLDASSFMHVTGLGVKRRVKGIKGVLMTCLGNSNHLWLWDEESIRSELEKAGFREVRRAVAGDSADPMFLLVESPGRWEGHLGIECRR